MLCLIKSFIILHIIKHINFKNTRTLFSTNFIQISKIKFIFSHPRLSRTRTLSRASTPDSLGGWLGPRRPPLQHSRRNCSHTHMGQEFVKIYKVLTSGKLTSRKKFSAKVKDYVILLRSHNITSIYNPQYLWSNPKQTQLIPQR